MKDILYRSIQCRSQFGIPRGAKMSLALNGPHKTRLLFIRIQRLSLSMQHQWTEIIDILYTQQTIGNQRGTTHDKKPH